MIQIRMAFGLTGSIPMKQGIVKQVALCTFHAHVFIVPNPNVYPFVQPEHRTKERKMELSLLMKINVSAVSYAPGHARMEPENMIHMRVL
jgi:hypothetical protein